MQMAVESASSLFPSSSASSSALLPQDLSLKLSAWSSRVRVLSRFVSELYLTTLLPEPSLLTALLYFLTAPYSPCPSASSTAAPSLVSRSSSATQAPSPTSSSATTLGSGGGGGGVGGAVAGCPLGRTLPAPPNPLATASWTSSLALCLVRIGIVSSFCRKAGRQVLLCSRPSPFCLLRKALHKEGAAQREAREGEGEVAASAESAEGSECRRERSGDGAEEGRWPEEFVREAMEKVGITEDEIDDAVAEEAEATRGEAERKVTKACFVVVFFRTVLAVLSLAVSLNGPASKVYGSQCGPPPPSLGLCFVQAPWTESQPLRSEGG